MADISVCPRCLNLENIIKLLRNKVSKKNQLIKLHKELSDCIDVKKLKYSSDEVGEIYKSAIKDAQVLRERLNFYINENIELTKLTEDLRCHISQLENKCKESENKLNHIVFINKQLIESHTNSEKEINKLKKKIQTLKPRSFDHDFKDSEAKIRGRHSKSNKSSSEEAPVENIKPIDDTDTESNLDEDKDTSSAGYKSTEEVFSDSSLTDEPKTSVSGNRTYPDDLVEKNPSFLQDLSDSDSAILGSNFDDEISLNKSEFSEDSNLDNPTIISKKINQEPSSADLEFVESEQIIDPDIFEDTPQRITNFCENNFSIFDFSPESSNLLDDELLKHIPSNESSSKGLNSSEPMKVVIDNSIQTSEDVNSSENLLFNKEISSCPKQISMEGSEYDESSLSERVMNTSTPKAASERNLSTKNVEPNSDKKESKRFNSDSPQLLDLNIEQEKEHLIQNFKASKESVKHKLISRNKENCESSAMIKETSKPLVQEKDKVQNILDSHELLNLNSNAMQCSEVVSPLKSVKSITFENNEECNSILENNEKLEENRMVEPDANISSTEEPEGPSPLDSTTAKETHPTVNNVENGKTNINNVKHESCSLLQYNGMVLTNDSNKNKPKEQDDELSFERRPHIDRISAGHGTFSPQYHLTNQGCVYEYCNCKDSLYHDRANFVWSFKDNSSVQISVPIKKGNDKIGIEINDSSANKDFSAERNEENPMTNKYSIVVNLNPEKVTSDLNCHCPSSRIGYRKFVKQNDCRSCDSPLPEKKEFLDNIDENVKWHKWRKIQELTEYPINGNLPLAKDTQNKKNSWSVLSPMVFPRIFTYIDTDQLREAFQSLSLDQSTFFIQSKQDNPTRNSTAVFSLDNKPSFYNPLNRQNPNSASRAFGETSSEIVDKHRSNFCLKESTLHQENKNGSQHMDIFCNKPNELSSHSREAADKSKETILPPKNIFLGNEQRKHFQIAQVSECPTIGKPLLKSKYHKGESEGLPTSKGIFLDGLNSMKTGTLIKLFPSERPSSIVIRPQTLQFDSSNKTCDSRTNKAKDILFDLPKITKPMKTASNNHSTQKQNPLTNNFRENFKTPTSFPNHSDIVKSTPKSGPVQSTTNMSDLEDSRTLQTESCKPFVGKKYADKVIENIVSHNTGLSAENNDPLQETSVDFEKPDKTIVDVQTSINLTNKQLNTTEANLEISSARNNINLSQLKQSENAPAELHDNSKISQNSEGGIEKGAAQNVNYFEESKHYNLQSGINQTASDYPLKRKKSSTGKAFQNSNPIKNATNEYNKPVTRSRKVESDLKEKSTNEVSLNLRSPPNSDSEIDSNTSKRRKIANDISDSKISAVVHSKKDAGTTDSKSIPEKKLIEEVTVFNSSEVLKTPNVRKSNSFSEKELPNISLSDLEDSPCKIQSENSMLLVEEEELNKTIKVSTICNGSLSEEKETFVEKVNKELYSTECNLKTSSLKNIINESGLSQAEQPPAELLEKSKKDCDIKKETVQNVKTGGNVDESEYDSTQDTLKQNEPDYTIKRKKAPQSKTFQNSNSLKNLTNEYSKPLTRSNKAKRENPTNEGNGNLKRPQESDSEIDSFRSNRGRIAQIIHGSNKSAIAPVTRSNKVVSTLNENSVSDKGNENVKSPLTNDSEIDSFPSNRRIAHNISDSKKSAIAPVTRSNKVKSTLNDNLANEGDENVKSPLTNDSEIDCFPFNRRRIAHNISGSKKSAIAPVTRSKKVESSLNENPANEGNENVKSPLTNDSEIGGVPSNRRKIACVINDSRSTAIAPVTRSNKEESRENSEDDNLKSPPISDSEMDSFCSSRRRIAHVSDKSSKKAAITPSKKKSEISDSRSSPEKKLVNDTSAVTCSKEFRSNKNKLLSNVNLSIKSQENVSLKSTFKIPRNVLKNRLPGFQTKEVFKNDCDNLEQIFEKFQYITPLSPLPKSPVSFTDDDIEVINDNNDENGPKDDFIFTKPEAKCNGTGDSLPNSNRINDQIIIQKSKRDAQNVTSLKVKPENDEEPRSDINNHLMSGYSSSTDSRFRNEESNKTVIGDNKGIIAQGYEVISDKTNYISNKICKTPDLSQENIELFEKNTVQKLKAPEQIHNDIIQTENKLEEDLVGSVTKNDKSNELNHENSQNSDTVFNSFFETLKTSSHKVNTLRHYSNAKKRIVSKDPLDIKINKSISDDSSKKLKENFSCENTEDQIFTKDGLLCVSEESSKEKEQNYEVSSSQRSSEEDNSDDLLCDPVNIELNENLMADQEKERTDIDFKGLKNVETKDVVLGKNIFTKKKYVLYSDDEEDIDELNIDSPKNNNISLDKSQENGLIDGIRLRNSRNIKMYSIRKKSAENMLRTSNRISPKINQKSPEKADANTSDKMEIKQTEDNKMISAHSSPQVDGLSPSSHSLLQSPTIDLTSSAGKCESILNESNDCTMILDNNLPDLEVNTSFNSNKSPAFRGFYVDTSEILNSDLQCEEDKCQNEEFVNTQDEGQHEKIDDDDVSLNKVEVQGSKDESVEERAEFTNEISCKKRKDDNISEVSNKKFKLNEGLIGNCTNGTDYIECKENLFVCSLEYFTSDVLNKGWQKYQKPNTSKKDISDIKYQVMRLAGVSEDNLYQHVNKVVQPLMDSPIMQPRPFAKAIIEILCEDNGKEVDLRPKMTKHTKSCLLFTISFIGYNRDFLMETLSVFEENLCAYYDKTLSVSDGVKLVTYYTALCRSYNLDSKAKQLIYDILYARHIKAYPMIYKCLQIWPLILPKAEKSLAEGCLLSQTIAFILISARKTPVGEKFQSLYKTNNLRAYLKNFFGYDSDFTRRDDLCDELVKRISEKGCRLALVLLAQCEGYDWAVTLVEKKLFTLLHAWLQDHLDHTTAQEVILAIGMIVRAFPLSKSAYFVKNTLDLLEKVLHRSPDKIFAETVIEAVALLRRHNLMLCVLILIKWIPSSKTVTKKTLTHARHILSVKNITHWRSFYFKHHTYEGTENSP